MSRLSRFIQTFASSGVGAFFVTEATNVTYLSDFRNDESFLFITPTKSYFLTDFRYEEQARREAKGFTVLIRGDESYAVMLNELCEKHKIKRLGVEANRLSLQFHRHLSKALKTAVLKPHYNQVEQFRLIKDKSEVRHLKKAVEISKIGVRNLANTFGPGMKEREILAKLEFDTKMIGSERPAFDIIIAAQANSSMPHAVTGETKVLPQDMLLVDMGCVSHGYHSDLTRCFFVGRIPPLYRKIYDIVLKAQELGIKAAKPGVKAADVDRACRDYIRKKGYAKYFGHGTGHGVGLEVHEAPNVSFRSKEVLEPGMVITVEPGIYLPGKFGVRIEDMLLITGRGKEILTKDIPK